MPAAERRQQLLDIALGIFARNGYHETSMNALATEAGVTKPVLYQHFASKHELFAQLLARTGDRLHAAIAERSAGVDTPRQRVEAGFAAFFHFFDEHPDAFSVLYGSSLGFRIGAGSIDTIDPAMGFTRRPLARLNLGGVPSGSMLYLAAHEGTESFAPGAGHYGGVLLSSYGNYVDASGISRFTPELYFLRSDVNDDDTVDLSDAISVISYLFLDGQEPRLVEASDINADGSLDLADAVYLLNFLYRGGPQPPAPFPQTGAAPH